MKPSPLAILSILDAKVLTGPARGLMHLARYLPSYATLHVALLRAGDAPLPPLAEAARTPRLVVHALDEGSGPFDPRVILRASALAREVGAAVVQSHSYKPHLIAAGARALHRAPWIAFHHGWTAENAKVKLYHAVDRISLRLADRVVAVSKHSEQLVLACGTNPAHTRMITNAVDPQDLAYDGGREQARDALGLPRDALVATAVGRLSHEKGQDVLLTAFARIAAESPALVVALAGDGPDRAKLEALAQSLGIHSRVHFLGHQRDVARVYAATDIAVLPSRSEGMPNALLEAMCLGIPAVACDVGGVSEVATHDATAWIVPSEDPAALGAALARSARDGAARVALGQRARDHVAAAMSPARRTERFLALYSELLGRALPPRDEHSAPATAASPAPLA